MGRPRKNEPDPDSVAGKYRKEALTQEWSVPAILWDYGKEWYDFDILDSSAVQDADFEDIVHAAYETLLKTPKGVMEPALEVFGLWLQKKYGRTRRVRPKGAP